MHSRHLAALLLSLALLLAQLGGFAHAASHLNEDGKERPHAVCELCVAYAVFDAGAGVATPVAYAAVAACMPDVFVPLPTGIASLPPYASRAPPHLV